MNGKTKELSKPELKERLEQLRSRVPRAVLIPIPYDADQTIIVRAHWRRGRNHLSKYPELRQAWQREVGRLIRQYRREQGANGNGARFNDQRGEP